MAHGSPLPALHPPSLPLKVHTSLGLISRSVKVGTGLQGRCCGALLGGGAGGCQWHIQCQRAWGREGYHGVPARPGNPTARSPAPAALAREMHLNFCTAKAQPLAFTAACGPFIPCSALQQLPDPLSTHSPSPAACSCREWWEGASAMHQDAQVLQHLPWSHLKALKWNSVHGVPPAWGLLCAGPSCGASSHAL